MSTKKEKLNKEYWKRSRRVSDDMRKNAIKLNDKRLKASPRNIVWAVRVSPGERNVIEKRFGGIAGLRDYALEVIQAESREGIDTDIK